MAREARQVLILQRFATLRVGKKNVLVLDLEVRFGEAKAKQSFATNLFLFRLWRKVKR